MARQLSALARLRALSHFDLELVGIREVPARDAEAARGHLLDRAAAPVSIRIRSEARGVFSALSTVALAADAVHGDRERLVRLGADRSEGHRAGAEAPHNVVDRLDLFERDRVARNKAEHAADGEQAPALIVDDLRVALVELVVVLSHGVLQRVDRLGIEQVSLAVATPLVLPAHVQSALALHRHGIGALVPAPGLLGDRLEADPPDPTRGLGEELVDHVLAYAHGLEDLCPPIAGQR